MKKIMTPLLLFACIMMITGCSGRVDSTQIINAEDISVNDNAHKLTMEQLIELSQKGDDLTWSDFEKFEDSGNIGSGLLILRYDIDEQYYVLIGGIGTDRPPMYIYLVSAENNDDFIDIRTESIADFINQQ